MLHCGCKIPVIASACVRHDDKCNLPVMDGYVGECPAKVLRHSTFNGVIRRSHRESVNRENQGFDVDGSGVPNDRCFMKTLIVSFGSRSDVFIYTGVAAARVQVIGCWNNRSAESRHECVS